MAEEFGDKTEEPTPKKLADARKKGFVAKSQDLSISILIFMTITMMFFLSGYMFQRLEILTQGILYNLDFSSFNVETITTWGRYGIMEFFVLLLPLLLGVLVIGLIVNIAQVGFALSFYPMIPKWQRINFFHAANYEKNLGWRAIVRLIFGLIRLNLVVVLNFGIIVYDMPMITKLSNGSIKNILIFIHNKALEVGIAISIVYILIAIADYIYQKWRFLKEMRMSKREVKEEIKQLEGDITMKSKIRSVMRSMVHDNLRKIVPMADLIIVQPGHYSVGLKYHPEKMVAPLVVCKGLGRKADEIVRFAKQTNVPIVENSFLAQSLYQMIEANHYITSDFYQRVAESMSQVKHKQKGWNLV